MSIKKGQQSIVDTAIDTFIRKYRQYRYRYIISIVDNIDVDIDIRYYQPCWQILFTDNRQESLKDTDKIPTTMAVICACVFSFHALESASQGTSPACWSWRLTTLIQSHIGHRFIISFITTVTIHYSFFLPLKAQNLSFPQILSSLVLPFHPLNWLHGLELFFVFLMHVSLALCARLSWLLVSFQVHIKSLHIIIIIIIQSHSSSWESCSFCMSFQYHRPIFTSGFVSLDLLTVASHSGTSECASGVA